MPGILVHPGATVAQLVDHLYLTSQGIYGIRTVVAEMLGLPYSKVRVVKVPMTEIAAEHENPKGANIVMMGAMAANSDLFTEDDLERLINEFFEKKGKINPQNSLCFRAGTQIH